MGNFENLLNAIKTAPPLALEGRVTKVTGLIIEGDGPAASVGEVCRIQLSDGSMLEAEVVGFKDRTIQLMPIGDMTGLTPGSRILASGKFASVDVGPNLLGRVLDGRGRPMDGLSPLEVEASYPIRNQPGNPLSRQRITMAVD
ncbi:MAG: hypothetical protein LBE31_00360, partial [Deltaproteobacteria bacterium]|nr:hypothetical protein [Deltaproteobacteria bacterium]